MRKRVTLFTLACLCGLVFFCFASRRALALHDAYPDPLIQTCQLGETVQYNSCQITFSGWQWGDGSLLDSRLPGYVPSGAQGRPGDVRAGLIELTVKKSSEGVESFDLADISFSSGAWGNQFDLELFYLLNPGSNSIALDLEPGEKQSVVLPITLLKSQFPETEWRKIDSRQFYINIQYYPEHIRFACPSF